MIIEYLFFALTALLAIGAPVYMFYAAPVEHGEVKTRLMYLRERKDVIYENLRDLNFEYRAGKFSDADYESLKSNMEEEATNVLAEISQLQDASSYAPKGARV
jgi:hypothetical protein